MAAPKNPRRFALSILRDLKKWTNVMVCTWDQPQSQYDADRKVWRKLMPHEKRENDPAAWDRLAKWMDAVSSQAAELADYARFMKENTTRAK